MIVVHVRCPSRHGDRFANVQPVCGPAYNQVRHELPYQPGAKHRPKVQPMAHVQDLDLHPLGTERFDESSARSERQRPRIDSSFPKAGQED
jgi:hypothetical protein